MKFKFSHVICCLGLIIFIDPAFCEVFKNKTPISAIDWLTEIHTPTSNKPQKKQGSPKEFSITTPKVTLKTYQENRSSIKLDQIYDNNIEAARLEALYQEISFDLPPSILKLFYKTLTVPSSKYPRNNDYDKVLFLRIQKLFNFGAIPQIRTLLKNIDLDNKFLFKIWLDTEILSYSDVEVCTKVLGKNLSMFDYRVKIYCLDKSGHKKAAILTLKAVEALNLIPLKDEINLHNYLYSLGNRKYQTSNVITPIDPLDYRIYKDLDNSFAKKDLSYPYYFSELSNNTNNLQTIEYMEDLVRSGVMSYDKLHALYSTIRIDHNQERDHASYRRAKLSQKITHLKEKKSSKNLSNDFIKLFKALEEIKIDKFARKYYSLDLLKLVTDNPRSKTALNLLISSCDISTLKKLKNISRLHPVYQNIIFDIPLKKTYRSSSVNVILNALRANDTSDKFQQLTDKNNQAEAILIAIEMLDSKNIGEVTNIEMSIKYFNSIGLHDIAREVALYTLANDIIEWK